MATVWLLDRGSGEWLDTAIVHPPRKSPVTVGDMWSEIDRQIAPMGYTIEALDLGAWMREEGEDIPEFVDYVVWVDYKEPPVPPGKKEWRPPEIGSRSPNLGQLEHQWRGMPVDKQLKDEWLERLNSIPGLIIDMTCAGGLFHGAYPFSSMAPLVGFFIGYSLEDAPQAGWSKSKKDRFVDWITQYFDDLGSVMVWDFTSIKVYRPRQKLEGKIESASWGGKISFNVTARKWRMFMRSGEFDDWWEAVIARLEKLPYDIPREFTGTPPGMKEWRP